MVALPLIGNLPEVEAELPPTQDRLQFHSFCDLLPTGAYGCRPHGRQRANHRDVRGPIGLL
ncbi:hypothetical protein F442_01739 [Phytophthora nicotianae P10297]|uniref:Uncharacterized protein n=1 Tax=Phytophthora nicotianae P10297 TaxID=1317064 RepID=W3A290_PHYNI|nr:hypothetical protein F442_01739 [Phytophthora nicotianae P10297]